MNHFHTNTNPAASKHDDNGHDRSSMFGAGEDDDERSLDSFAMELSGPRQKKKVQKEIERGKKKNEFFVLV